MLYFNCGQDRFARAGNVESLAVVQRLLETCSSVEQVLRHVGALRVSLSTLGDKQFPAHWLVCDASNSRAVLEVEGEGRVAAHVSPSIVVLTNYPSYSEQLRNWNRYKHLSARAPGDDVACYSGSGAGDPYRGCAVGLPGDSTSPSRFVRASFYVQHLPPARSGAGALADAFSVLRNFDLPLGSVATSTALEVTEYTVAYDVTAQVVRYAPYGFQWSGREWTRTSHPVKGCPFPPSDSRRDPPARRGELIHCSAAALRPLRSERLSCLAKRCEAPFLPPLKCLAPPREVPAAAVATDARSRDGEIPTLPRTRDSSFKMGFYWVHLRPDTHEVCYYGEAASFALESGWQKRWPKVTIVIPGCDKGVRARPYRPRAHGL